MLLACAPVRSNDDDSACATGLRVCATMGDAPSAGSAFLRAGSDDTAPLESPLGDDGCVAFSPAAGSWEWRASDDSTSCVSAYEPVEVSACETVEVSVDLAQWCMDG